jgi:hypothetical protein
MRINKSTLNRQWLVSTLLALAAYAVLASLDVRLKALSGVGTFDLQSFTMGAQFDAAFHAWGVGSHLSRAGFNLGFDYLFMPLCAAAMFYSGVLVTEAFTLKGSGLRRILSMATLAPLVAAALDMVENAMHLTMLWNGSSDSLARFAHTVSTAKLVGFTIGLILLLGAVLARVMERQKARLRQG